MARYGRLLTEPMEKIRPLLPKRRKRPQGGRPPADDRKVLEASCGFCAAGLLSGFAGGVPSPFDLLATRDWESKRSG